MPEVANVGVPAGWTDDGVKLRCPNGFFAAQGFRDAILNWPGGWQSWDWLLEDSVWVDPVEIGNPALGGGTRQITRAHMLAWTKARGVYVAWIGQELEAWIAKVSAPTAHDYTAQMDAVTSAVTALGSALKANGETK